MISLEIPKDIVEDIKSKPDPIGELPNSILEGEGNIYNAVAVQVFERCLGLTAITSKPNRYHYNLEHDGRKIELKVKVVNSEPRSYYETSIADSNTNQKCDDYLFGRVKTDFSKIWILGSLPRDEYFKRARFRKVGDVDPSNGQIAKQSCHQVRIDELDTTLINSWFNNRGNTL